MRKRSAVILAVIMLMVCAVPCSARTVSNDDFGIAYILSDEWIESAADSDTVIYEHINGDESLGIHVSSSDVAYTMELASEPILKETCDEIYSDYNLAQNLSEANNNALVTVKTDSVISGYEYYGNKQYYRYEKAYTASAFGYNNTPFYLTSFLIIKNGRLYLIEYDRNYEQNNFQDVVAMLHSLSFELGEIKINVNNTRIQPDSSPVIIESRTLVPIRAVAESLGYSVSWDSAAQIVTMTNGTDVLRFGIGSNEAYKNEQMILLDVPAQIISDRTYLPLRAVAEAMNAEVGWDAETKTVSITG